MSGALTFVQCLVHVAAMVTWTALCPSQAYMRSDR